MIQPTFDDFPTFRRHYTRLELASKLAETRRRTAAPLLSLVVDNDISDQTAIAVQVGTEKLRLTPYLPSREIYIALHCMSFVPRIWDYEEEHSLAQQRQPKSRVQTKAFGRRK